MKTMFNLILLLLFITGCGNSALIKGTDKIVGVEKADIKVADKIADNVKVAEDVKIDPKMTIADKSTDINQKANRDIRTEQTSINDTDLMKYIMYILGGIITCLIIQFIALLKWQGNSFNKLLKSKCESYDKLMAAKDLYITNLVKSNSAKDEKIDEWQNQLIVKLIDKKDKV